MSANTNGLERNMAFNVRIVTQILPKWYVSLVGSKQCAD